MKRCWIFLIAVAVSLAVAAPRAFADVKTDYDHHADFSAIHSYCWGQVKAPDTLVANRIKRAVGILLQQRGWRETPDGCQVTIFAMANVHNQQEMQTYYNGWGGGWGMGWGWGGWGWGPGGGLGESQTTTYNQPVGHLVIDMFQTDSKNLLWRGIARGNLSNDPGKDRKTLYKNIHEMFDHFPVKKSS